MTKNRDSGAAASATQVIKGPRGTRRQMRQYRLTRDDETRLIAVPSFSVGSHRRNDLVIDDPSVSRFHVRIEAGERGYLVRDLDSTNGTHVDGLRVMAAYLPPRATLRLGEVSLEFALTGQRSDLPLSDEPGFCGLLGRSPAMREVFSALERVAPTTATVLVEGESGTGKERIAEAVHQASPRAGFPFVLLDCAAVPSTLMESELFGHERGAFTGAVSRAEGRFREADGGTLFLDEIGELPLDMQPKLLRVLESRQVRALGSTTTHTVDVRLVAATNRDLAREVNRGTFREDLFYRLAVVQIKVPPLRERPEDIRLLVEHFIMNTLSGEPRRAREILRGISDKNWRRLERLPWPGNVRELRNFIERTLIMSGGPIESQHVPGPPGGGDAPAAPAPAVDLDRPFREQKAAVIAAFEHAYLLGQLTRHDNNVSAAARASGMDRMNFKRSLSKHR